MLALFLLQALPVAMVTQPCWGKIREGHGGGLSGVHSFSGQAQGSQSRRRLDRIQRAGRAFWHHSSPPLNRAQPDKGIILTEFHLQIWDCTGLAL